jgi:hypothetical protein
MLLTSNVNEFYHKIYTEPCKEFEEIRELCLLEDNWLRHLYTPENLKIENHSGFAVVFTKYTHEPVGMGGVFNDGRYPKNIARHLHREYLFPKFRQNSRKGYVQVPTLYNEHLVKPLTNINNFDCYIIAMQNREKKQSKGYWKIFSEAIVSVAPEWKIGENYIQTCPFEVQKCWQNYLYYEVVPNSFQKWNPKLITHAEWEMLDFGI